MSKIQLRVPRSQLFTGDRKAAIIECRKSRQNVFWQNDSGGITIFYLSETTGVVAQKSARVGTFEVIDDDGAVVEMEPIVGRSRAGGPRRATAAADEPPQSDDDAAVSLGDAE